MVLSVQVAHAEPFVLLCEGKSYYYEDGGIGLSEPDIFDDHRLIYIDLDNKSLKTRTHCGLTTGPMNIDEDIYSASLYNCETTQTEPGFIRGEDIELNRYTGEVKFTYKGFSFESTTVSFTGKCEKAERKF